MMLTGVFLSLRAATVTPDISNDVLTITISDGCAVNEFGNMSIPTGTYTTVKVVGDMDVNALGQLKDKVSGQNFTTLDMSGATLWSNYSGNQKGAQNYQNMPNSVVNLILSPTSDFNLNGGNNLYNQNANLQTIKYKDVVASITKNSDNTFSFTLNPSTGEDAEFLENVLTKNGMTKSENAGPKFEYTLTNGELSIEKMDPSATDADLPELTAEELQQTITSIKLSGEFTNADSDNGKLIMKLIQKYGFSETNRLPMLDLSGCSKMVSQFVSVADVFNNNSDDGDAANFTYNLNDDNYATFTTVGFKTLINGITFPSNNPNFTFIPNESFKATNLQNVVISNGIKAIGNKAFQECKSLLSVSFPVGDNGKNSLSEIGIDAFQGCSNANSSDNNALATAGLSTIDLSNTQITVVRVGTFNDCRYLSSFSLPEGVTQIRPVAFKRTYALTGSVSLPNSIIYIGKQAFMASYLSQITLPTSLETIAEQAFYQCLSLGTVNMPHCITIEKEAFRDDTNLTTVVFPDMTKEGNSDATIGEDAFYNCNLSAVNLQNWHNLTLIDKHSFYKNVNLGEVHICTHTKTIKGGGQGNGAFDDCEKIALVQIHCCTGTHVDDCVCERDAFDQKVTYGDTDMQNIDLGLVAELIYCDESGVSNQAVSGHTDTNVFKDNDYTYASPFDFFVGDWKDGLLITQKNLNEQWRINAKNGWQQFLNGGHPFTINEGTFLRTYSRTAGSGAVILPEDVIAYRMVDYKGQAYNSNNLTISGYFELKKLETEVNGKKVSYVPEETGVVLWSPKKNEEMGILVLSPCSDDIEATLKKYPNTQGHYQRDNSIEAQEDRVNLLMGSYGETPQVGPVDSYDFDKKTWKSDKAYRNFGLSVADQQWQRIMPTNIRANRAWAQIPLGLFNNYDEKKSESPNLDMEQNGMVAEDNGTSSGICIGMIFEGETDGIFVISQKSVSVDDAWYTLEGVKVSKPVKGIYIHQNKKVVVK